MTGYRHSLTCDAVLGLYSCAIVVCNGWGCHRILLFAAVNCAVRNLCGCMYTLLLSRQICHMQQEFNTAFKIRTLAQMDRLLCIVLH